MVQVDAGRIRGAPGFLTDHVGRYAKELPVVFGRAEGILAEPDPQPYPPRRQCFSFVQVFPLLNLSKHLQKTTVHADGTRATSKC